MDSIRATDVLDRSFLLKIITPPANASRVDWITTHGNAGLTCFLGALAARERVGIERGWRYGISV